MTEDDRNMMVECIKQSVAETVKETVNGKIDKMRNDLNEHNVRHEEDMKDLKPIIEAYNGGRFVGSFLAWLSPLATAVLAYLALKGYSK